MFINSKLVKKIVALSASVTIASSAFVGAVSVFGNENAHAITTYKAVTNDTLNLRAGEGTHHNILSVIPRNTEVTLLSQGELWCKVRLANGTEGYVATPYLNITATTLPNSDVIRLDTTKYENTVGSKYRFMARVVVADNGQAPTASSSDSSIVSVKFAEIKPGVGYLYDIELLKEGTATISVKKGDEVSSFDVKVIANQASNTNQTSQSSQASQTSQTSTSSTTSTNQTANIPQGNNIVTVNGVTIALDTASYSGDPGTKYRLLAKVTGSNSTPQVSVSDMSVVGITSGGKDSRGFLYDIKLLKSGTATISFKVGDAIARFYVVSYGELQNSADTSSTTSTTSVTSSVSSTTSQTSSNVASSSTQQSTSTSSNSSMTSDEILMSEVNSLLHIQFNSPDANSTQSSTTTNTNNTVQGIKDPVSGKNVIVAVTTTELNIRNGAGTNYQRLFCLDKGANLTPLEFTNNGWLKVRTNNGTEGYVSTQYLDYLYNDGSTTENSVVVSLNTAEKVSVAKGQTLYLTATQDGRRTNGIWYSSDTNVATVSNGYIYAVNPGTCNIFVSGTSGVSATSIQVEVTDAEPVRTAYVSPNIIHIGNEAEIVAVTDKERDRVLFEIQTPSGNTYNVQSESYTVEDSVTEGLAKTETLVFKANARFDEAGTYFIRCYSYKNGVKSAELYSTTAYVVSTLDKKTSSFEERRVSDDMLNLIARWEGYSAGVYADKLANNIPTIGYGQTFGAGAKFYNNLTKTEAWSMLLASVNEKAYTTEVNKFLTNNKIKANQHQFDAMVSFSYNIGAGYWNSANASFDIRTVLLNAVVPPEISSAGRAATTNLDGYLLKEANVKSEKLQAISRGTHVTVLSCNYDPNDNVVYYYARLADGTEGYIQNGICAFDVQSDLVHDLNYTDANKLGSELIRWSTASGTCYAGLVYRRLSEAKVFSFGNYEDANPSSANYGVNTYGYTYPSYAAKYEK